MQDALLTYLYISSNSSKMLYLHITLQAAILTFTPAACHDYKLLNKHMSMFPPTDDILTNSLFPGTIASC